MQAEPSLQAVVIGSGVGGAGIAAQLAQAGFQVTVFERNPFAGGKTAFYTRDGFIMDIAAHVSPRCEKGPIGELIRRVHAHLTFSRKEPMLKLYVGDRQCEIPMALWRVWALLKTFPTLRLPPLSLWGIVRFGLKILSIRTPAQVKAYEGMTAAELFQSYSRDPQFYAFLDIMTTLMFVVPAKEASAADFLWAFAKWIKSVNSGYPDGGYSRVPHCLLDVVERHGGVLKLNEEVTHIKVEHGVVKGVETKHAFYPADLVVSNAGFKKTVFMTGTEHFEPAFVERASALKDSAAGVVVQLALDYKPTDAPVSLFIPDDGHDRQDFINAVARGDTTLEPALFITSPTVTDPRLAPAGKSILLALTWVPADLAHKDAIEVVMDRMERRLHKLFPGIEKHILWKIRRNVDFFAALGGRGAGEAIGLAQRFDQDGKNKPHPRLPVKGLYAVGADAGGTGIGTELAADSALHVFDLIMQDIRGGALSA